MTVAHPITDRKIRFALVGCGRISVNHIEALTRQAGRANMRLPMARNRRPNTSAERARVGRIALFQQDELAVFHRDELAASLIKPAVVLRRHVVDALRGHQLLGLFERIAQ